MSVDFYISKLNYMYKGLSDNKTEAERKRKGDEFLTLKDRISTTLHEVRQKQDERDKKEETLGRGTQVVTLCSEIRDLIKDLDKDIKDMNTKLRKVYNTIKKTDKTAQDEYKKKELLFKNLKDQVDDIKDRENMGKVGGSSAATKGIVTMTEMRSGLYGKKANIDVPDRELNTDEKEAMQRWKEKEKLMDQDLLEINEGLVVLESRARNIGETADMHNDALDRINRDADAANKNLSELNQRMNKVLREVSTRREFYVRKKYF